VNLGHAVLANAAVDAVHDRFVDINVAIPDFQVKTAFRIGTHPCLIFNRRPLAAEVREGYEVSSSAF
jgi:hypothetical protein